MTALNFFIFFLKEAVQLDGKIRQCIALLVYLVYQFNNKNDNILIVNGTTQ